MIRHRGRNPPQESFAEYGKAIERVIWAEAEQKLLAGLDIIVDAGFWLRESRELVRGRLDRIGAAECAHKTGLELEARPGNVRARVLARRSAVTIEEFEDLLIRAEIVATGFLAP